ncbi:radical SAM protein [Candidatus Bathyarchaeota archaeon]|nr:radical SAM protein [Candidatus Bathyarchaeota archaeon]
MNPIICQRSARCVECGFCKEVLVCPSPSRCVGCQVCYRGCPYEAVDLVNDFQKRENIHIKVNGEMFEVTEGLTVRKALETLGYTYSRFPQEGNFFAPCETGGCYSCVLLINGQPERTCMKAVEDGMDIVTELPLNYVPRRIISGPSGHSVGGKATPWWLKAGERYIEVAIWTAGCNLRCPTCQNYEITYDGRSEPVTPYTAAELVTAARRRYNVDRMAISGGEPTINRKWLVSYFKILKKLNPDSTARFHLDSNATILTPDYIDELVEEAYVTDIGLEPKGLRVETFMKITGITDINLAKKYHETAWNAVKYTIDRYKDRVFIGIGIPYNKFFMNMEEIREIGSKIAALDSDIQVCVLDYFPTFRRINISRPSPREMLTVKTALEETGLKTVVVQTSIGHFGPNNIKL